MKRAMIAGLLAMAGLCGGGAVAQDGEDDWDFGADPARNLAIAAVTFDNFGVAVRCMNGSVSVLISGLPVGSGERYLRHRMGRGPEIESRWVSGRDSTTVFAVWPRAMAQQLAGGGRLAISAPDGDRVRRYAVDLPASPRAIDQVYESCGQSLRTAEEAPSDEDFAGLRWVRMPTPSMPARAEYEMGMAAISCVARRDGSLRDCRVESEFPEGSGFGRASVLGGHRTGKLAPVEDGADIEGRRLTFVTQYYFNDGYIPPPPSRLPGRDEAYNPMPDRDDD